jgi:outer membrane receptor for ferrienterochelin and colicin
MKKFLIAFFLFQFIFIRAETLIDEVIVVGSYLKSTESDLSPINIINKDLIDDLNISSIAEISKYITSSSGSHFQANTLGGVDQGMASITLRGLDHASTLVLINSKRHTFAGTPSNQGEGYIDVNIIPEIAINRVEILKEGATSLYGSDAVAGVIMTNLNPLWGCYMDGVLTRLILCLDSIIWIEILCLHLKFPELLSLHSAA